MESNKDSFGGLIHHIKKEAKKNQNFSSTDNFCMKNKNKKKQFYYLPLF